MSRLDKITAGRKTHSRPRGYIEHYRPQNKTRDLLAQIESVLEEYRNYWPLTCRQVFYRLVGSYNADKTAAFYDRLCHHLANARRAGIIPFDAIRDDGVSTYRQEHFADADAFRVKVRQMAKNYQRNLLASQPCHVEVWCESAGMLPQLAKVAAEYSVQCYSSGGFDSLTAKKDLADRIVATGKSAFILHFGDYDPSGESIFNSVAEDVAAFVNADRQWMNIDVNFQRVALTANQVAEYNLATAPAKSSDSRAKDWTGGTCQLEALEPDKIAALLEAAIMDCLDIDQMDADRLAENIERDDLTRLMLTDGRA